MRLRDKTAVITGGASGMGLATAQRFLEEGAKIVIADFNQSNGQAAVDAARDTGHGDQVTFVRTDVANEGDVEAMIGHCVDLFGGLDILFNNAGVGGAVGPITESSVEDWDYTFNVLAKGVFLGIKHAAKVMRSGGGGSIINTASIAGLSGDCGPILYSAAKASVISLTKSCAIELADSNIRVNAICPGFISTPLAHAGQDAETIQAAFASAQPWPEYGRGEHIAGAALFLASDDAAFITGEAMVVDGGMTAAGPQLSKRFPKIAGRGGRYSGITTGSTGTDNSLRKID